MDSVQQPVLEFECRSEFVRSGWRIAIHGNLGEVIPYSIRDYIGPLPAPGSFKIEAMVAWEVLGLKGKRDTGPQRWQIEQAEIKKNQDSERPR